jgi:hypothetical protein
MWLILCNNMSADQPSGARLDFTAGFHLRRKMTGILEDDISFNSVNQSCICRMEQPTG